MQELFNTKAETTALPLEDERQLIEYAQAGVGYSAAAQWDLLRQYRGLLQKTANQVRSRVRGMTKEQIEDLQSDLVLTALDTIQAFDLLRYVRLSQVLPSALAQKAAEMATALTVPAGVLSRWFRIWRAANQDYQVAERLAPSMGMTTDSFKAIQHALAFADYELDDTPYTPGRPVADTATYDLAHRGLALLSDAEREVVELAYGFRGEPKPDSEVADIVLRPRNTVKFQRTRALDKMRRELTHES